MDSFKTFLEKAVATESEYEKGAFLRSIAETIDLETKVYKEFEYQIIKASELPTTADIPKEDSDGKSKWLRIDDVSCCFVDMINSTSLSTTLHAKSTAEIYRYFTGTAIKIFRYFDSPYIDVKGDGVFALFDSGKEHQALAATVTFKTFVKRCLTPNVSARRNIHVAAHAGIDRGTLLVRRVGIRKRGDDDQGRNEVWAGKVVNRAAKLAGLAGENDVLASNSFWSKLSKPEALESCGCQGGTYTGNKSPLWEEIDLSSHENLKIDKAMRLSSQWCEVHGIEYCTRLSS